MVISKGILRISLEKYVTMDFQKDEVTDIKYQELECAQSFKCCSE